MGPTMDEAAEHLVCAAERGSGSPLPLEADVGLLSPVVAGTEVAVATGDRAWLQAMLDAESGLARAQARLGMIPDSAAAAIAEAAIASRYDLVGLAREARGAANPVVAVVRALTAAVRAIDVAAADYVHRGSTSQDVLDTAAMLVASRCLRLILRDLSRTSAALFALAEEHRGTVMAARTLGLHAVPTTFGLKVAGWLQGLQDAEARLRRVATSLPVELGGAAGTLAGYVEYARVEHTSPASSQRALDEYADALSSQFADEMGLRRPLLPWHTTRTPVVDIAFAMAFLTGALAKMAVDVALLSRTEVAEVSEPRASGRGVSSAMPHKRNPALATLIRAAALQVPPLAAGLAQSMLAEDERSAGAWHAEWQPLRECLRLAGGAAATAVELAEGLVIDPDRMRRNVGLTAGLIASERLAVAFAPILGSVEAKAAVARAATEAIDTGEQLTYVVANSADLAGRLSYDEVAALLDPAGYTGVAVFLTDGALADYRSRNGRTGRDDRED